jgi:TRAP-type C4-dicarboxylate transport system permease small subunit
VAGTATTSSFERFYRNLTRVEVILAAVFLTLMVVLIFTGGVARMMRYPLNWTVDFSTCFFAWAAFLAADAAWRNNALMGVTVLTSRLGGTTQRALFYINHSIICLFLLYVIYAGIDLAVVSAARSFQGIPWISYSWITMSLPVGGMLLLVTTLVKMRDALVTDGLLSGRHVRFEDDEIGGTDARDGTDRS